MHIPATTSLAHHLLVAKNACAHKQGGAVRRCVHLGGFVDVVILGGLVPSAEGRRFEVHLPGRKNSPTAPPQPSTAHRKVTTQNRRRPYPRTQLVNPFTDPPCMAAITAGLCTQPEAPPET
eukprot:1225400-Alexandrium_andersonii.AAC.1